MIYSSAIFSSVEDTLEEAQLRKLNEIAERGDISSGDEILEIGCGWGEMAIFLATKYGCNVTGLTLSTQQLEEAQLRITKRGLQHKVKILLCDYRNIPLEKKYDKIVSIEMIEAVGHEYLETYFQTLSKHLRPSGKAIVQAISYPDNRYHAQLYTSDFIKEHIFPGGHLPCLSVMSAHAEKYNLVLSSVLDIGKSYATTLAHWSQNWESSYEKVLKLGYSHEFYKKYLFYFHYCAAGFQEKLLLDYIVVFNKV